MAAELYDTHCHLDFPNFRDDLAAVVERAHRAGVTRMVTIGTDEASSRRALELAAALPGVWAAVGWHPSEAMRAPEDVRPTLRALAAADCVVAIGEIGLDHYRLPSQRGGTPEQDARCKTRQAELFRQQLEVAAELQLPVVIHQRQCLEAALEVFAPFAGRLKAVFHCFTEGPEALQRVLDLGAYVSFTGVITFANAELVRQSARAVPDGSFMVETDAPFLAPVPHRGKRCEPLYVRHTAETLAAVRGVPVERLAEITCATARGFFRGWS